MSNEFSTIEEVAGRIRAALNAPDLDGFTGILDPDVTWCAPDACTPTRHDRRQVVAWYQRGRDEGVRWEVTETVVGARAVLVGLRIIGFCAADVGAEGERWQVLSIRGGRVCEIRGYESRDEAAIRAGVW
jgi:hypothetical protein